MNTKLRRYGPNSSAPTPFRSLARYEACPSRTSIVIAPPRPNDRRPAGRRTRCGARPAVRPQPSGAPTCTRSTPRPAPRPFTRQPDNSKKHEERAVVPRPGGQRLRVGGPRNRRRRRRRRRTFAARRPLENRLLTLHVARSFQSCRERRAQFSGRRKTIGGRPRQSFQDHGFNAGHERGVQGAWRRQRRGDIREPTHEE